MAIPLHITFKGLAPRADVTALIEDELAHLTRLYERIVECRVRVEIPHRREASASPVHVLIEVKVPHDRLVVDHAAEPHHRNPDGGDSTLCIAVREAFGVAQRQLAGYADRQRHDVGPSHTPSPI
jgi:Sigma 54 modulation protein / S30EA ribosomal protein